MKKIKLFCLIAISVDIFVHCQYPEIWNIWKMFFTGILVLLITGFFIEKRYKKTKKVSNFILDRGHTYLPKKI
jgi:galactitol-specific phosphotransferase system IIC component